jgi:hypothetical protein
MWKIKRGHRRGGRGKAGNILRPPVLGGVVAEIAVTEIGYVGVGVSDLSRWHGCMTAWRRAGSSDPIGTAAAVTDFANLHTNVSFMMTREILSRRIQPKHS